MLNAELGFQGSGFGVRGSGFFCGVALGRSHLRVGFLYSRAMNVLVAGGAGDIGAHTVKRLKEAGHQPVIYDNVSRGHREGVDVLQVPAVVAHLNDRATLLKAVREQRVETVMHFAAYAYVGESVDQPLMYYHNNVATTISVLEAMREANVERFVFSSTCATYGDPEKIPITENEKQAPVSPYGRSKLMVEHILKDLQQ